MIVKRLLALFVAVAIASLCMAQPADQAQAGREMIRLRAIQRSGQDVVEVRCGDIVFTTTQLELRHANGTQATVRASGGSVEVTQGTNVLRADSVETTIHRGVFSSGPRLREIGEALFQGILQGN